LRQLLRTEAEIGVAPVACRKRTTPDGDLRNTNRIAFESLDWALLKDNGWGLAAFVPDRRVGALAPGATRYYIEQPWPITGAVRSRACIMLESGERYFEVPCAVKNGAHYRPTLHLCQDMGSGSWHGSVFAIQSLGIRGSLSWDRFHRHQCDLAEATARSGLSIIRLEMTAVLGLRRAPWGKEGNHDVLVNAAKEMFDVLDSSNELLQVFFSDICADLDDHPVDEGSEEHYKRLWERCRECLTNAGVGHAPKRSRWWSVETLARQRRSTRSMLLMLLIFVGVRRKWWRRLSETPLFDRSDKPLEEGGEPDPKGLEALADEEAEAAPAGARGEAPVAEDGLAQNKISLAQRRG